MAEFGGGATRRETTPLSETLRRVVGAVMESELIPAALGAKLIRCLGYDAT